MIRSTGMGLPDLQGGRTLPVSSCTSDLLAGKTLRRGGDMPRSIPPPPAPQNAKPQSLWTSRLCATLLLSFSLINLWTLVMFRTAEWCVVRRAPRYRPAKVVACSLERCAGEPSVVYYCPAWQTEWELPQPPRPSGLPAGRLPSLIGRGLTGGRIPLGSVAAMWLEVLTRGELVSRKQTRRALPRKVGPSGAWPGASTARPYS
jgi:hypothetical protein